MTVILHHYAIRLPKAIEAACLAKIAANEDYGHYDDYHDLIVNDFFSWGGHSAGLQLTEKFEGVFFNIIETKEDTHRRTYEDEFVEDDAVYRDDTYWVLPRQPRMFDKAYIDVDDIVKDVKLYIGEMLPDDFDIASHLVYIEGVDEGLF